MLFKKIGRKSFVSLQFPDLKVKNDVARRKKYDQFKGIRMNYYSTLTKLLKSYVFSYHALLENWQKREKRRCRTREMRRKLDPMRGLMAVCFHNALNLRYLIAG